MEMNVVHNPALPYQIVLPKMSGEHLWTMQRWCYKNFGVKWNAVSRDPAERSGRWTMLWCGTEQPRHYRWHFRDEKDAIMFALRWS